LKRGGTGPIFYTVFNAEVNRLVPNSKHVVCPHCQAVNRIPEDRLQEAPRCGRCKERLFTGRPVELSEQAFARHLQRDELPLVVDFWASWCGPCKVMAPHFETVAEQLEPRVRLAKLNTEQAPQTATQLGIRSIPTVAIFVGGREIARQAGAMDAATLNRWIRSQL
jgi:thioredoxin 2